MADQHESLHGRPPVEETSLNPSTPLPTGHATPYAPEGTGLLGGEAPLHAHHDAQSGSTALPNTERLGKGREVQGLAVVRLLLGNKLPEGTSGP